MFPTETFFFVYKDYQKKKNMLQTGLSFTSSKKIKESDLAVNMGSGDLEVLATPAMATLMENAAMNAVSQHLPEGSTTVGGSIEILHLKPSAINGSIKATAKLEQIDGRKLVFSITAEDETGEIGKGTHSRFIVDKNKFMSKLNLQKA